MQSHELSESEMADDDNAETSEMGDMLYSNQSGLNQSNLSQISSQKSTSLDNTKSDEATYHLHRIRKTTKLVKRCINSELKFQPSVVRTAHKLLNTPDELTLDEIEELNLNVSPLYKANIPGNLVLALMWRMQFILNHS